MADTSEDERRLMNAYRVSILLSGSTNSLIRDCGATIVAETRATLLLVCPHLLDERDENSEPETAE